MDEDGVKIRNGIKDVAFVHSEATSINNQYAAWAKDGHVNIQKVASPNHIFQFPRSHGLRSSSRSVLELCTSRPNLLAVSAGAQAQVFDLSIQAIACVIPGIGRTVTALAWSRSNENILATGSVDGSICIWDLRTPERPIRRLRAPRGPCKAISFSTANSNSIACIQEQEISIWNLRRPSLHPASSIRADGTRFCTLAWQPGTPRRLVVATEDGLLKLYDVSDSIGDGGGGSSSSSGSSENGDTALKRLKHSNNLTPSWTAKVESSVNHIQFLNEHILYALTQDGHRAFIYELEEGANGISDLYSRNFEYKVDAIHIRVQSGTGVISAVGEAGVNTSDLPVTVLDKISRYSGNSPPDKFKVPMGDGTASPGLTTNGDDKTSNTATMKPISIMSQRRGSPGFSKTSDQLQLQRRLREAKRPRQHGRVTSSLTNDSNDPSTPTAERSLISSLELPNRNDENGSTSMPFLSPSIPSRHSPNDLPSLEDSTLTLPPLVMPSFDSSLPSTNASTMEERDSDDSDDDTFVEALEGSAAFLPGGINVPLPKACGALFAPNGQLLTFFPPKLRLSSVQAATDPPGVEANGRQWKARNIPRLFPSFGRFGIAGPVTDGDDDSESSASSDSFTQNIGRWPQVNFPHSSFPSQQSWPSKVSPIKGSYNAQSSQSKIVVSVYEIDDVSILCTTQRTLANNYRILSSGSESGADVCDHNFGAAKTAGLQDVAYIWSLLSMLLCNKVPLELLSGEQADHDVLVVARQAKTLTRSDSGIELATTANEWHSYGRLRWGDNPFGASWLVRRVLAWAEQRADIQLLACICAVLTDAQNNVGMQNDATADSFVKGLSNSAMDYLANSSARRRSSGNRVQPIPVLRTNSLANSSVYESPVKLHRSSNTSSRNASQPTTPHLDSTSSTPPFPLSLSRQATHLSTSGSASPEYQRGSFSAAAKYYALSITDKFSSYGTSPPTKKLGTSPSANELSTSMPNGSWGKSVSFAMSSTITDTTRGSLLSRSYDEPPNDGGYDSDRTVDDSSPVHQPRDPSGAIRVTDINQAKFSVEISGAARTSIIPEDLAGKTYACCGYYA